MDYTIFAVLGVILIIYLFMTIYGKKKSRTRKDRKFMEGYGRSKPRNSEKKDED